MSHVKDIIKVVGQKKPIEVLKATQKWLREVHLRQYIEVNNALYLDRAKTLQRLNVETIAQKYDEYSLIQIQYDSQYKFIAQKKSNQLMRDNDSLLAKLR